MTRRPLVAIALAVLVLAGCTAGGEPRPSRSPSNPSPSATTSPPDGSTVVPAVAFRFAPFTLVPLLGPDAPAYAGPETPTSLDGVLTSPEVRQLLRRPQVAEALAAQGFAIVPADFRLFHMAYDGNVYDGWPVFVTTDVAYHTWHLVFDKLLRSLEQEVLLPKLETLVAGLLDAAERQADEAAGSGSAEAADRLVQLLQVAGVELGLDVGALGPLAEREHVLIETHGATQTSPILGTEIDYSLYTPRGHYTRNEQLTRFFLGMSVLGQSAFCLPGATGCPGAEPLRMGVLAARILTAETGLGATWRDLYEPTGFLVGLADDYTPFEVADAAGAVEPGWREDPDAFGRDAAVDELATRLAATRPVRIDPEKPSMRLMGTRFVIDSWILDQMIAPNVGTPAEPRLTPSPLDLAAAFGSGFAYDVQRAAGETRYRGYDAQLGLMRDAIARRPEQDWGGTVYDAWLSALEPMWRPHGEAFPDFMRTRAWAAKDHQTGFGSYAELKHDTILFTKQAVAEGGDGLPVPPRTNWVEPDPVAFQRLQAVADLTHEGLSSRGLLRPEQDRLLRDLSGLLSFFGGIAEDELAGTVISGRANERLTHIGGELESFWWRTADRPGSGAPNADEDAAIVADIASSPKGVLEVATGRIDRILVLVPDGEGVFQVAMGGVSSYYGFLSDPGERLTDELWRQMLDEGNAPPRPSWEPVVGG
ncbi:MAG: DUF3160 domain-containing protein [Candidatus Velamenicoccus archaeovorus]